MIALEKKFRVWDTKELVWRDGLSDILFSFTDFMGNPNRFRVVQYSGLKDKNDKEIYENDIVRDTVWGSSGKNIRVSDIRSLPSRWFYVDSKPNLEVIGNIYENPRIAHT